jgi:hypothetical protein
VGDFAGFVAVAAAVVRPKADDELVHVICWEDEDVSLCGLDVSDARRVRDDHDLLECVVCTDMEKLRLCSVCGCKCWIRVEL